MASLLPGVYGSRQSEGAGCGVTGAVVALVDPARVEVSEVLVRRFVGLLVWLLRGGVPHHRQIRQMIDFCLM